MSLNPYHIAITRIPGLGAKIIRQLVEMVPDVSKLFEMSHSQLVEIFGTHQSIISAIESKVVLRQAEAEIIKLQRFNIDTLFFTEESYPQRLNRPGCEDTPVLLYRMGSCNLNPHHAIAIVGSRKCTDYGRTVTSRLVREMTSDNPLIVSGLAYGIDTAAHTAALDNGLPTVAILGHGLDIIYPAANRPLAKRILDNGGALLTEYPLETAINPRFFPARNRIVAALADATIVSESSERSGSLITANLANSYHREVFAVPGRLDDPTSYGCNNLIANNKALIIRNAGDLYFQLGWHYDHMRQSQQDAQQTLFATLSPEEQTVADLLLKFREMTLDEIAKNSTLSLPKIASILMEMELKKAVRCLPGRIYKLM